ncbi:MAG: hypothetical protein O3A87_11530 [Verrucomicrobia bacterium]|nr:hypothetical protein [Verrucomicrobiota bacterium]MDA1007095.1 hypothetical protein [Verrucomicrobiota bacterium]
MKYSPKTIVVIIALFMSILVICGTSCMGTASYIFHRHENEAHRDHRWLHHELNLDEDDLPDLAALETSYLRERALLLGEMEDLQAELSGQLL